MKLEQTVYETVPAGRYAARVQKIESDQGQWGTFLKIVFELDSGVTVVGAASAKFSNRSKLYRWTKALLGGKPIPKGWDLDTDVLVGRCCEIVVDLAQNGDGEFNRIDAVLPAARTAAPAPAEPDIPFYPTEPPPEEPF
jgi:hypothetical protein